MESHAGSLEPNLSPLRCLPSTLVKSSRAVVVACLSKSRLRRPYVLAHEEYESMGPEKPNKSLDLVILIKDVPMQIYMHKLPEPKCPLRYEKQNGIRNNEIQV